MQEEQRQRYLTPDEASELTGYKASTLVKMARQGRIPSAKLGSRWRFPERELTEWIESNRRDG